MLSRRDSEAKTPEEIKEAKERMKVRLTMMMKMRREGEDPKMRKEESI